MAAAFFNVLYFNPGGADMAPTNGCVCCGTFIASPGAMHVPSLRDLVQLLAAFGEGGGAPTPNVLPQRPTCGGLVQLLGSGLGCAQLTEIAGAPQSGKTSLALLVMATLLKQQPQRHAIFVDLSGLLVGGHAGALGVCGRRTRVARLHSRRAVWAATHTLVATGHICALVLDAVTALPDDEDGDQDAWQAPMRLLQAARRNRCALFCTSDLLPEAVADRPAGLAGALSFHASRRVIVWTGAAPRALDGRDRAAALPLSWPAGAAFLRPPHGPILAQVTKH